MCIAFIGSWDLEIHKKDYDFELAYHILLGNDKRLDKISTLPFPVASFTNKD